MGGAKGGGSSREPGPQAGGIRRTPAPYGRGGPYGAGAVSADHANEQVIEPMGRLLPLLELAVKPNVVEPFAEMVPL